jgi:glycosyltransferase involved in cell wall biosynthesis
MGDYVVIPAYNEGNKIIDVVEQAKKFTENVVVIDDGSRDDTAKIAEELGVVVLKHPINLGKGAALKTGCDFAVMQGAKKIVVIDGDGQHDPKEIPEFFGLLKDKEIVFSYRKRNKEMPGVLKFGNWFINKSTQILYGVKIKDTQCGYRAFTASAYRKVRWRAQDYFMETEMIINTGKKKLSYTQHPIETIYADKYKGTTVFDGVKIVMKMIASRL